MRRFRDNAPGALHAFARGTRASAGIELALGAAVLIPIAALCFDLYARVAADTSGTRCAAVMADYVSRGPDTATNTLDGAALEDLGEFLHNNAFGAPADLVFVLSALRQPPGDPAPAVEVLWSDGSAPLRFGDATVTTALAADCSRFVTTSGGSSTATLPAGFTMAAGEVIVVAEICARLTRVGSLTGRFVAGDVYRHHVLPAREPALGLPAPVHPTV